MSKEDLMKKRELMLVEFYKVHEPSKVKNVVRLLGHYEWEDIMSSMVTKYGESPEAPKAKNGEKKEEAKPSVEGGGGAQAR
jgi:hypothetical protein